MPDREVSPLRVSHLLISSELSRRIREWGKAQGLGVSERGRIASQVIDAFFVAHPDALAAADRIELVRAVVREPGDGRATPDDYAWQDDFGTLGPSYTLTFVQALDEGEVLHRFGVAPQDVEPLTDGDVYERLEVTGGQSDLVMVVGLGEWTVAVEKSGWQGVHPETLRELSRDGGQAMAVSRQDYARHRFAYAADGQVLTSFNPEFPGNREGVDPGHLDGHLRALGIDPAADDQIDNHLPAALALASRISGVMLTPAHLEGPLLGGRITTPLAI
ncbi:DUF6461 domain-containing protein [Streptosporangium carneum]|uniref:Lsr2 DNA-binding domain-containing protein n=1 Tax=Streptosporangium carneum TaxID=47481 RepID=A0A9W6I807_9ACTN|nr:DUF6461 domain-containing protein [Streptosporangium carneum]GLK13787.1 hypothetical protein GCM10017600_71980 [Streptosporangium carneum]